MKIEENSTDFGERDRFETNENPRLERKECPVITFIRRSLPLLSLPSLFLFPSKPATPRQRYEESWQP